MITDRPTIDGVRVLDGARFPDHRGTVGVPYEESAFRAETGRPLFPVRQTIVTTSRAGSVRGIHYTATPPGTAKLVHCTRGRVLDIAVDLRTGSPTFGQWNGFEIDTERLRAVYLPVGVGHLWVALTEGATMLYLLSASYRAERERAVAPDDPQLGLPIPAPGERLLSERDAGAPTLAEAQRRGLLPELGACGAAERELGEIIFPQ